MASPNAALAARLRYLNDAAHLLHAEAPSTSAALGASAARLAGMRAGVRWSGGNVKDGGHGCGACGAILVPPLNCQVELPRRGGLRSKRARGLPSGKSSISSGHKSSSSSSSEQQQQQRQQQQRQRQRRSKAQPLIVYTCERCLRKTHVPLKAGGGRAGNGSTGGGGGRRENPSAAVALKKEARGVRTDDVATTDGGGGGGGGGHVEARAESDGGAIAAAKRKRSKAANRSGLQAMLAKSAAADAAKAAAGGSWDLMDFMKTS